MSTNSQQAPDGWQIRRVDELGQLAGGSTPSTTDTGNFGGEIVWLVPSDLTALGEGEIYVGDSETKLTHAGYKSCSTKMLPQGSICMSSRATVGECAIARLPLCTNQGFINISCNDGVDNRFLLYWIKQNTEYISRFAAGTTFLEIPRRTFGRLRVCLPIDERMQARIADQLYAIDRVIAATQTSIAASQKLKQTVRQNLLTGKLKPDGTWRREEDFFIDQKFGRLPKGWEISKLKKLGTFFNGANFPAEAVGTGYPFVNLSDVFSSPEIDITKLDRVNVKASDKLKLEPGDLLFVRSSVKPDGIGLPSVFFGANEPVIFCGFLIRFSFDKERIRSRYLCATLRTEEMRNKTVAFGQVGANTNISQRALGSLSVTFPTNAKEQESILDALHSFDISIDARSQKLLNLRKIKAALMQNLLTGKIRIPAE